MEQDMKAAAPRIRTIDLGYEQMMIFDDGRGDRVRVLYGATWLTREGDGEDTVLRPGAERALGNGAADIVIVSAIREGDNPMEKGAVIAGNAALFEDFRKVIRGA